MEGSVSPVLYKRRWAFLCGIFVLQFFAGISFASYGQISGFYTQFFNTTHSAVDWITNARNICGIFVTLPLCWMVFMDILGLRGLVLLTGVTSTVGLLFVTLSFLNGSLMGLIIIGQTFCGLAELIGVAIPATFAALWFPENQVGTAIAATVLAIDLGDGTGYLLPSFLLYSTNQTWNQTKNLSTEVMKTGQHSLQNMYLCFLVVSGLTTIFFAIFFSSTPTTPPTFAQALKENEKHTSSKDFWKDTKLLFTNYSYMFVSLVFGLTFQLVLLENTMMSEIVKGMQLDGVKPVKLSGYIMSLFSFGAFIGVPIFGKVVDVYKEYKLLAVCNMVALLFSTVGIAVCVVHNKVIGIFVSNAMFGFFTGAVVVVFLEMVTQLTYPIDETLSNIWMTGIQTTVGMVETYVGRILFEAFGNLGVLSFQCFCVVIGLLLISLVSSRNHRLEAGFRKEGSCGSVHTPLLNDNANE